MSKHKVKRYDGEEGSEVSAEDEAAMDAAGRFVESGPKAKVVTKEQLQAFKTKYGADKDLTDYMNAQQGLTRRKDSSGSLGRKPSGPSQQNITDTEPRDRFGIPTSLGDAGKNYAPTGRAAESASGSELMRNIEAAGNTFGASGAMQAVRRGDAVAKGLREFAAGRAGAKPAMEAAKRVEPAMKTAKSAPSVNVRSSAADPKIMEKVSAALKNAPRPVSKLTPSQAAFAKGPKGPLSRLRADTMDEFGAAMKRGGSVKKMASGGAVSSFRSSANGIAQRGKTRGKMC
jgi:hypothetical protein